MIKYGCCQDPDCDLPDEKSELHYIRYAVTLPDGGWVCDGCLEAHEDCARFLDENRLEMGESGYNTGEVLIK